MSLFDDVFACMKRHDLPETTFGKMALNDPGFVALLRNGRAVGARVEAKVRAFIEQCDRGGDPRFLTDAARAELLGQVVDYCARLDIPVSVFGRSLRDDALVHKLRSDPARVTVKRADTIRAFMAKHPNGFDREAEREKNLARSQETQSEIDAMRRAAEARHEARAARAREVDQRERMGARPSEQLARVALAEPHDAIALVKRRWPDLLDRLLDEARSAGRMPGELMVDAIEAGLAALAGEIRHAKGSGR